MKPYTGSFRLDEGFDVALARRAAESLERAIDAGSPQPWAHVGISDHIVTTMGDRFGPVFHFFTAAPTPFARVKFYDLVEGDEERKRGHNRRVVQPVFGVALRQANHFEIARVWQLLKSLSSTDYIMNSRPGTWWEIAVD